MKYVRLTPKGNKTNLFPLGHIVRVQPHRSDDGCLIFLTNKNEPLEVAENMSVIEEAMEEE